MDRQILSTVKLIQFIEQCRDCIEGVLLLRYGFRARHFLTYDGNTLYDEGIDGIRCETTLEDFQNRYPNAHWYIDE
jgi:hypothetical protein